MNKKLVLPALAVVFFGLGLVFSLRGHAPEAPAAAAAPVAASPAAALFAKTLPDAAGQPHALSQWQGKPVLVNFWATWCPPCVQEMPELVALGRELAPRGIHVIGIGIDSPSNIAEFSAKHHITYPLYVGGMEGTSLMQGLGNKAGGLPFTVLIGADGQVRKVYLGRLDFKTLRADLGV